MIFTPKYFLCIPPFSVLVFDHVEQARGALMGVGSEGSRRWLKIVFGYAREIITASKLFHQAEAQCQVPVRLLVL